MLRFFEEMDAGERAINNQLKIMHYLAERDSDNFIPFLGVSNLKLDALKINRVLNFSITDYDLEETAI